LAVNLSDAFTFEEQERMASDNDLLEMKTVPPKDLLSGGRDKVTETGEDETPTESTFAYPGQDETPTPAAF